VAGSPIGTFRVCLTANVCASIAAILRFSLPVGLFWDALALPRLAAPALCPLKASRQQTHDQRSQVLPRSEAAFLVEQAENKGGLYNWGERVDAAHMNENTIDEMEQFLKVVINHVQADTRHVTPSLSCWRNQLCKRIAGTRMHGP
jgi:hypothetical protein